MTKELKVIVLEQDNKEDIYAQSCITCMWIGHKGHQFPRPTCIKLYDYKGECFQICLDCLKKVQQKLEKSEEERQKRMQKRYKF